MKIDPVLKSVYGHKKTKKNFNTLISQHSKIINALYSRYGSCFDSKDDFLSESYIVIFECIQDFDPERGLDINVYIYTKLKWRMYSISRQNRSRKSRFVLCESIPDCEHYDNYKSLEIQSYIDIYDYLNHLRPRQRTAVIYRYLCDQSYEAIALQMNVKEATVRSLVRHGLNRLRTVLPINFSSGV